MQYNFRLEEKEIQDLLFKKGYYNKLINYSTFLDLYDPYKSKMSERDFAKILEISYYNLKRIQRENSNARILKSYQEKITEERQEEIKALLRKNRLFNSLISYEQFLELYKPYKTEMLEDSFANILGISTDNFKRIKNQNSKTRILKFDETVFPEEVISKLQESLKSQGFSNKLISYSDFLRLYEPYKYQISEFDFSKILLIPYSSFYYMKTKNIRARILKSNSSTISYESQEKILDEKQKEIQSILKKQGLCNTLISYSDFLKLYEPYNSQFSEIDFSKILLLSRFNFYDMKKKNRRVTILKSAPSTITDERRKQIQSSISSNGYLNKLINYEEFLELYEPYKSEMPEYLFAKTLGISSPNFSKIKTKKSRTRILSSYSPKPSTETKNQIKEFIENKGLVYSSINYTTFLELYNPYKSKMTEHEFAEILGISEVKLTGMKSNAYNAKINFNADLHSRIKHLFSESKFYNIADFEKVIKQYNCAIEEILTILFKDNSEFASLMLNSLLSNGKLFIGKMKLDTKLFTTEIEELTTFTYAYSRKVGKRLTSFKYCEDIAQDILLRLIETRGDIFENLTVEDALEMSKRYIKKSIKGTHFSYLKIHKSSTLTLYTMNKTSKEIFTRLDSPPHQIQTFSRNDPISFIHLCIDNGMNREECLQSTMQKFNLSSEKLLDILTKEVQKKNQIKKSQNGSFYLVPKTESER